MLEGGLTESGVQPLVSGHLQIDELGISEVTGGEERRPDPGRKSPSATILAVAVLNPTSWGC